MITGAPPAHCRTGRLASRGVTVAPEAPAEFSHAVAAFRELPARPELRLSEADAPRRLAPWSFALRAEIGDSVLGRLVLLHDPEEQREWEGTFRLVCYLSAELDPEQAADEALPGAVWSWLTDALGEAGAEHRALRGTVTRTSSVRFGERAGAAARSDDVELRCSWTPAAFATAPSRAAWRRHVVAFCALLSTAAGLPPVGVVDLGQRARLPVGNA